MCLGRPAMSAAIARLLELGTQHRDHFGDILLAVGPLGREPARDPLVVFGFEVAKAPVLKLPFELPYAEAVCERCVDFARFAARRARVRQDRCHVLSRNRRSWAASLMRTSRGSVTIARSILRSASAWLAGSDAVPCLDVTTGRAAEPHEFRGDALSRGAARCGRPLLVQHPASSKGQSVAPIRISSSSVSCETISVNARARCDRGRRLTPFLDEFREQRVPARLRVGGRHRRCGGRVDRVVIFAVSYRHHKPAEAEEISCEESSGCRALPSLRAASATCRCPLRCASSASIQVPCARAMRSLR